MVDGVRGHRPRQRRRARTPRRLPPTDWPCEVLRRFDSNPASCAETSSSRARAFSWAAGSPHSSWVTQKRKAGSGRSGAASSARLNQSRARSISPRARAARPAINIAGAWPGRRPRHEQRPPLGLGIACTLQRDARGQLVGRRIGRPRPEKFLAHSLRNRRCGPRPTLSVRQPSCRADCVQVVPFYSVTSASIGAKKQRHNTHRMFWSADVAPEGRAPA